MRERKTNRRKDPIQQTIGRLLTAVDSSIAAAAEAKRARDRLYRLAEKRRRANSGETSK
jgi:hypothetical protein